MRIRNSHKISTQALEVYNIVYNNMNCLKLTFYSRFRMKIGAGAILFSYFLSSLDPILFIFLIRKTYKLEKFNLLFFSLGSFKHCYELFFRKFIFK